MKHLKSDRLEDSESPRRSERHLDRSYRLWELYYGHSGRTYLTVSWRAHIGHRGDSKRSAKKDLFSLINFK